MKTTGIHDIAAVVVTGTTRGQDDDDEDEEDASEYEMDEIFDESLSINHWSDRQGNKVGLGEIRLGEDEKRLLFRDFLCHFIGNANCLARPDPSPP
jgi:hypothetical protein